MCVWTDVPVECLAFGKQERNGGANSPALMAASEHGGDMIWTPADSPRSHFGDHTTGTTPFASFRNPSVSSKHTAGRETRGR